MTGPSGQGVNLDAVVSAWQFAILLMRLSLRHYVVVFLSVSTGLLLMAAFAVYKGPLYTSTMTVKAADDAAPPSGLSSALSRLPVSLGGGGGNAMLFSYLNLLQSNEVAGALIKNDHFERELYNGAIDPATGRWRHTWLASIRGAISEVFGFRRSDSPTLEDVRLKLKQMLVIDQDQLTNLVTVSCTSASQTLCRDTLLAVNREAETSLNQMRRRQAEQTRDYIEQVLPAITEGDVRANMIGSLLDAKTQIAMSNLNRPIGASVLDPPLVPSEPSFPRPSLLLLLGFVAGLAFGVGASFLIGDRDLKFARFPYARASAA